jgi:ATP-dependent DNA helicase DinG
LRPEAGVSTSHDPAPPGSLAAKVARVFADGGPLARAVPEFEARPGQRAMAMAVAGAIDDGRVLLAEAGTGTGKTLAYLVPAILSGRRVLVSTGTKTLQEQILSKDLPDLQASLGVPFTATCMKGRGNYLCLHRFETFRDNPMSMAFADLETMDAIAGWAGRTETGDRAELEDMPEDLSVWSDISATSENCVGSGCPRFDDCFITRMRRRAAESDLVIVNHHLLCADASVRQNAYGEVIPECLVAVIDEAHQLEDVATQYFGLVVSTYRIDDLVRDTERVLAVGGAGNDPAEIRHASDRVRDRAVVFFQALRGIGSAAPRAGRPAFDAIRGAGADRREDRQRVTADALADVHAPGAGLIDALDGLQGALSLVREPTEDSQALARRAGETRDELKFLLRAGDPDYVYHVEARGRGVFLRASPIDVSAIVRELLIDRMQATVLTSATLSVGGSFDYVRARLGVADASELRLPSEFRYTEQAILYLPVRMPDPRSPLFPAAASREIVEILRRTEGRAFVLFTSYSVLREVERDLASALDYPVLVQGSAPRSVLLKQFRSLGNAVLLATASFWQGVDVVGEALSCVIVDKLPFASPADPVTAARIEAIAARGESAFERYQLPLAILTLTQGLGRLIRHRRDRGVLAVLDPRLRTKGYGARFLDALPPARVVSSLDEISRFFER